MYCSYCCVTIIIYVHVYVRVFVNARVCSKVQQHYTNMHGDLHSYSKVISDNADLAISISSSLNGAIQRAVYIAKPEKLALSLRRFPYASFFILSITATNN